MKHLNIAATLGYEADSVEDLNEGFFLQPQEASTIDAALGNASTNSSAAADLVTANETIAGLNTKVEELTTAAEQSAEKISGLETEVADLKAQLGEKPSGKGSVVKGSEETTTEATEATKLPRYDDPNHPANLAASRRLRK